MDNSHLDCCKAAVARAMIRVDLSVRCRTALHQASQPAQGHTAALYKLTESCYKAARKDTTLTSLPHPSQQ